LLFLALAYLEHLGAAYRADPLRCRPAILHRYPFGIFHLSFGTAFHTVALHKVTSYFLARITYSPAYVNSQSVKNHQLAGFK
jgi:hypothetical protein